MKKAKKQPSIDFRRLPNLAIAVFVAVFALIGVYALASSQAAPKVKPGTSSAQLYLTSTLNSVAVGQTFTVGVRINPPQSVDGIEATITYNATQLQFVSVDSSSSAFPVTLQEANSGNAVKIVRGIFAPDTVNGDSFVSNVTFKSLKSSNNSTIQISGQSTVNGAYLPLTSAGTSFKIR